MFTRRDFLMTSLGTSPLVALAPAVPAFLARTARAALPERDARLLVVIFLDGGNDGINTVVPYRDEGYPKHRQSLRLPEDRLIKIDDQVALHPAMRDAATLLETGRLAIIQGVSYPNPNLSHFESGAIWHTARFDPEEQKTYGWIGRALDSEKNTAVEAGAMFVGAGQVPIALRGRRSAASAIDRLDEFVLSTTTPRQVASKKEADDLTEFVRSSTLNAYSSADRLAEIARAKDSGASYPATGLATRLRLMARLIKAGFGTRVYYTSQPGYDTHYAQLQTHSALLGEFAGALRAFLDDLAASGLADRVTVLVFSEFGRRVAENGSQGTDHGTAAPVFLAGPGVQPGLAGPAPNLVDLDNGNLKWSVDFRRIYATALEQWLGLSSVESLGRRFEPLPLFKAAKG